MEAARTREEEEGGGGGAQQQTQSNEIQSSQLAIDIDPTSIINTIDSETSNNLFPHII